MSHGLRLLLPTANWARFLVAPVLVFVTTAIDRGYQTDFWHHLARGRAIAQQGQMVDVDLFTYTVPGKSFQDVNWLTQLFYYHQFEHGGLAMVQLVNSATLALMMALLVLMCWRASGSFMLAGTVGVFTFFGLWQILIIRPQTFSLLLFVLLYGILEMAERRRWLLLLPPLLLALWVNIHGGFPIGLILIFAYLLAAAWEGWWARGWGILRCRRAWALALCLGVSGLATLLNPYGWKVYQYVSTTSSAASSRRIEEWMPPGMELFIGKMWVVSVLLILILFALPRRRPRVCEVCLILCFLPLACGSVRMVAWWLLISSPIAAGLIADNLREYMKADSPAEGPSWGAAAFVSTMLLAVAASVPSLEQYSPLMRLVRGCHRTEDDLQTIADRLGEEGGRIFSRFEWGEYLGWSLAPNYTIFMDGRIEIYPDDVWWQYSAVTRARADWEKILAGYDVDYLLLDAQFHGELLPQVETSARWELSCRVGDALLFHRRDGLVVSRQLAKR